MLLIIFVAVCIIGVVSVLGWAPWAWWPVLPVVYGLLYAALANCRRPLEVAALTLGFGATQHLVGHGWLLEALYGKAGLSLMSATASACGVVLYLAMFVALPSYVWARLFSSGAGVLHGRRLREEALGLAGLLTLGEWGRSQFFNGFTSLSVGYAWLDTPLAGYIPLVGVYGVSLVVYSVSFLLPGILRQMGTDSMRAAGGAAMVGLIVALGALGKSAAWVKAEGPAMSFRLIQTNVRQERKFDPAHSRQEVERLKDLVVADAADLIATPETAFPVFFQELPGAVVEKMEQFSATTNSHLLLGMATMGARFDSYNSILHIGPDRGAQSFYNKIHLMPFGEYSPWGFGWFTNSLRLPLKDLTPGRRDQKPFRIGTVGFGILICQEDLVGDLSRQWAGAAGVILNPSNMAWFEHGLAIPQRLQIVRARALEVGRPILRTTNSGIAAYIDYHGKVVGQLPAGQAAVLAGKVQPTTGRTPFAVLGDWPVVVVSLGLVALAACSARRRSGAG